MGGIVADPDGRSTHPGLFAVGECAATGVHGANRLASNSLLEAAAFGRRTGRAAAAEVMAGGPALLAGLLVADLPDAALAELRTAMSTDCGVVREAGGLTRLIRLLDRLEAAHGAPPALIAARLIAEAALARRESRGGHYRSDYPGAVPTPTHTRLRREASSLRAAA
jgi:L-aspartate oxidase